MTTRVLKYPLFNPNDLATFEDRVIIKMYPASDRDMFVGMQNGIVMLWAVCACDDPEENRTFTIRGTGHAVEAGEYYVGTVFDRQFVWHIFEAVNGL